MAIVKHIEHATRIIGAPKDWKPGDACVGLPIRDVSTPQGPFMVSAWELTPAELTAVKEGATIKLWIRGTGHPVVKISVEDL
jgi:hypothetical protein